jgi:hypothetical protein
VIAAAGSRQQVRGDCLGDQFVPECDLPLGAGRFSLTGRCVVRGPAVAGLPAIVGVTVLSACVAASALPGFGTASVSGGGAARRRAIDRLHEEPVLQGLGNADGEVCLQDISMPGRGSRTRRARRRSRLEFGGHAHQGGNRDRRARQR